MPRIYKDFVVGKKYFHYISLIIVGVFFLPGLQAKDRVFTIVIDAGHGGKDPGARGSGVNEKDINLSVALKLGRMLTDNFNDVRVVYTRSTDVFVELDERANIANRQKADLFMSIHANAIRGKSAIKGTETYTLGLARSDENLEVAKRENAAILLEDNYLQKYEGFDPNSSESYIIFEFMQNKHMEQSIGLASEIQKAFATSKRTDRGVRQAGFLVLTKTSMPSVLVELGYMTHVEEVRYMNSQSGQKQLAESLYNAFLKYKREYDRKQGILTDLPAAIVPNVSDDDLLAEEKPAAQTTARASSGSVRSASTAKQSTQKVAAAPGETVYKVQILASDKKLSDNSPFLKGYKAHYYQEKGMYKYTYGETTDEKEIQKLRKELAKKFKGAFVISFRDGKKVTN